MCRSANNHRTGPEGREENGVASFHFSVVEEIRMSPYLFFRSALIPTLLNLLMLPPFARKAILSPRKRGSYIFSLRYPTLAPSHKERGTELPATADLRQVGLHSGSPSGLGGMGLTRPDRPR